MPVSFGYKPIIAGNNPMTLYYVFHAAMLFPDGRWKRRLLPNCEGWTMGDQTTRKVMVIPDGWCFFRLSCAFQWQIQVISQNVETNRSNRRVFFQVLDAYDPI
jgi:hypothetical protein